ncbi:hypothetical protein [Actinomadura sp. NEAU-AAG7]|uniref:MmyB family transcriptional regulator n=1 Tax=Actinomadura sp. NEAU-AAG7 TaxID=2839640 RepID=UPI001BE4977E|nr:hypothetical protein [Actinomadura sp. NEAU-AAG7]MBT2207115.1 hypothetical protein [Actinomadura sp. NEAU-AAG7]
MACAGSRAAPGPAPWPRTVRNSPRGLRYLPRSFETAPELAIGRHTRIVGWNRLAAAVSGGFAALPEGRRTLTHLLFAEPHQREPHRDGWERTAREHAAHLRVLLGRFRGDPALTAHVDDMRELSPGFARLWAEHPVAQVRSRSYRLHHPVVGRLTPHGRRPGPVRRRAGLAVREGPARTREPVVRRHGLPPRTGISP